MRRSRIDDVRRWELMISSPHGKVHVVGTYLSITNEVVRETLCGKRPVADVQLDTYDGPFERSTACMKCRDAARRFGVTPP